MTEVGTNATDPMGYSLKASYNASTLALLGTGSRYRGTIVEWQLLIGARRAVLLDLRLAENEKALVYHIY